MAAPKQGHWVGVKAEPDKYYGFIYLITNNKTGLKYIGKKNYWFKKRVAGCKAVGVTDRQDPKWRHKCYKESDWKTYRGSSKHLTKDIKEYGKENFEYCIIKQCRSKGTLSYSEVEAMIKYGVMTELSDKGSDGYAYYNRTVPHIRFKVPKVYHEEETLDVNHTELNDTC